MERETAGDPISGLKWTRKTTDKIARQLKRLGIAVSRSTVGRLLRQMRYSLRTNRKKISAGSTADRDRQFRFLCRQRDRFEKRGDPVLSVDAKKRELIGNFKNPGVKWEPSTTDVNDHDFRSTAKGIGIPYGIYDTQANRGCVFLGTSHETSAFAVSCLRKSWNPKCLRDGGRHGMRTYFVECKTPGWRRRDSHNRQAQYRFPDAGSLRYPGVQHLRKCQSLCDTGPEEPDCENQGTVRDNLQPCR